MGLVQKSFRTIFFFAIPVLFLKEFSPDPFFPASSSSLRQTANELLVRSSPKEGNRQKELLAKLREMHRDGGADGPGTAKRANMGDAAIGGGAVATFSTTVPTQRSAEKRENVAWSTLV